MQFFSDERALQADLCQGGSATTLPRGIPLRLYLPLDTGAEPRICRDVVRSGDLGRVRIYGLQVYGIFKVRFLVVVWRMPVLNR